MYILYRKYWSQLSPLTHIVNVISLYILLLLIGKMNCVTLNSTVERTNERMLFDTGYDTIRYNTTIGGATNHPVSKRRMWKIKQMLNQMVNFTIFLPFSFFFCNSISMSVFIVGFSFRSVYVAFQDLCETQFLHQFNWIVGAENGKKASQIELHHSFSSFHQSQGLGNKLNAKKYKLNEKIASFFNRFLFYLLQR